MILVTSHAWAHTPEYARAYLNVLDAFEEVHRRVPGFRGRFVTADPTDPLHVINHRFFDERADYEALIAQPDYADWIDRLSALIEPRDPMRTIERVARWSFPT